MFRDLPTRAAALAAAGLLLAGLLPAQERRSRIDVERVMVEAEVNPAAQTLSARAAVRFTAVDDAITSATFELNSALSITRVVDEKGAQVPTSRNYQDSSVRLSFEPPLPKGQAMTVNFYYEGKLSGQEESPVYGIKFASIQPEYAYLMYPSRWFPVAGYSADRFAALMRITAPNGFTALGSGLDSKTPGADKTVWEFKFDRPSFPGSIALVKGAPVKASQDGVNTTVYFRGAEAAQAEPVGQEVGRQMAWFTGTFGLPPYADLTVVETDEGAPNAFSAPGLIFLSPRGIGRQPNLRTIANQVSRQWWEALISPLSRNHLWLTNGLAAYSEILWTEHVNGPGAADGQLRDLMVEALTMDTVPVIQAGRLDDYSPEYWALTGSKGAAVVSMLRYVVGDDKFFQILKTHVKENAWKSVSTDDFRKLAETVAGQELGYFFIEWIESSGAPEFKPEYTTFRTSKGFRVMGKISQDLDTFRMPMELRIETEGNPEEKRIEVAGSASEFNVETFGKPKTVVMDPNNRLLRYSPQIRVAVAIRKGEQYAELSQFNEALNEYNKALETNRTSSLAHYRKAEVYFLQQNWQSAANEFREALNGDLEPKWTEVWAHINLGKIYDVSGQRERAVNEYNLAVRTKDDTQRAQEEAGKYIKTPYERQKRVE